MPDQNPDPSLVGVLSVLAEKMGLSPSEFATKTIVIQGGQARVVSTTPEATDD